MNSRSQESKCLRLLSIVLAFAVSVVGSLILAGWHLHQPVLTRLLPGAFPTPYANAVCLLFAGMGILGILISRQTVVLFFAGLCSLIAFSTLFNPDSGYLYPILAFLSKRQPWLTSERISVSSFSSIFFLLLGFAILLGEKRQRWNRMIQGFLTPPLVAVGFVALFCSLLHAPFGLALGATMAALSLFFAYSASRNRNDSDIEKYLPLQMGTGVVTLAICASLIVDNWVKDHAVELVRERAKVLMAEVQGRAENQFRFTEEIIRREAHNDLKSTAEMLIENRGLKGVRGVDRSGRTLWGKWDLMMVPDEVPQYPKITLDGIFKSQQSQLLDSVILSEGIDFVIPVSNYKAVAYTFVVREFLDFLLSDKLTQGYKVTVWENGERVYFQQPPTGTNWELMKGVGFRQSFSILGKDWVLSFEPLRELVDPMTKGIASLVLAVGLLMSLFVTVSLELLIRNRRQSDLLSVTNQELRAEIVERKRAQEDLAGANEIVRQATHAKSLFLANMSHEIRTPLNAIIGMSQMLRDTPLNGDQQDSVDTICTSADVLLSLVNDVLDVSKIEAGKLDLNYEDYRLDELLKGMEKIFLPLAQKKYLNFQIENGFEPGTVLHGDSVRLTQILINLINNSIKFTHQGGVTLHVAPKGEIVAFEVVDTGIGIDGETQKKLFVPFTQADSSMTRKYGGTGLGLSISHRLVNLMSGEIGVESALERGSRFWFKIPLIYGQKTAPVVPIKAVAHKKITAKILLAEDNPVNQKVLKKMMDKLGATVTFASDGVEAWEIFQKESFDLVILDCQMPRMDGYEVCRRIRLQQKFGSLPVIALTAHALVEDKKKCLDSGMNDFLTKPIKFEKLAERIGFWMSEKDLDGNAMDELVSLCEPGEAFEFLSETHRVFAESYSKDLKDLENCLGRKDKNAVKAAAHKMKSAFGNMGATLLHANCAEIEQEALKENWARIREILNPFPTLYQRFNQRWSERAEQYKGRKAA